MISTIRRRGAAAVAALYRSVLAAKFAPAAGPPRLWVPDIVRTSPLAKPVVTRPVQPRTVFRAAVHWSGPAGAPIGVLTVQKDGLLVLQPYLVEVVLVGKTYKAMEPVVE